MYMKASEMLFYFF